MINQIFDPGNPKSLPEIQIRRLGSEKWREYRALRLEALRESSIAFGSSYEESTLLPEAYWNDRLKDAIFAVVGDQIIGMLVLSFNQRSKTKHLAEIFSFYVNREYRGIGAGKKLMSAALEEAMSRGNVVKVRLSVNPEQKIAISLYRAQGFKIVGLLKQELLINGRFHDEVIMEKFL